MKQYKKEIDSIFEGITDKQTDLPQSAKDTISRLPHKKEKGGRVFAWRRWMAAAAALVLTISIAVILSNRDTGGDGGTNTYEPYTLSSNNYYQDAVAYAALATMDNRAESATYRMAELSVLGEVAEPSAWGEVTEQTVRGEVTEQTVRSEVAEQTARGEVAEQAARGEINALANGVGGATTVTQGKAIQFSDALGGNIAPMSDIYVDENGNWFVRYSFTAVRIDNAFEFYVDSPESGADFLTEKCGAGELRVIVAYFTLFDGPIEAMHDEAIVVVVGQEGMLHCLLNGGGGGFWEFSMHKFLDGTDVVKDSQFENMVVRIEKTFAPDATFNFNTSVNNVITQYSFVDGSYDVCDKAVLYDLMDIVAPFVSVTVKAEIEDYKLPIFNSNFNVVGYEDARRVLTSYTAVTADGTEVERNLFIVIKDNTVFDGIRIDELIIGATVRVEFASGFTFASEENVLIAQRIYVEE